MGNTVSKFRIGELWETGINESWFASMSEKGFHLQSIGKYFVRFEKREPKKTKYRIVLLQESPSQEELEVYERSGWKLVTSRHIFYIFSTEDSKLIELPIDEVKQNLSFETIFKNIKKSLIGVCIGTIFIIVGISYQIFIEEEPYIKLIRQSFINLLAFGVIYLIVLYESIRSYMAIKKIKNSLDKNIPINQNQKWRLSYIGSSTVYILLIVIVLMSIAMPFYTTMRREIYTSPKSAENLPFIKLEDVESKEIYDYWHDLDYDWSILSPVQYDLYEGGYVDGVVNENFSGGFWSVSLNTKYYKLTFKNMAEGLLNDLINRYYIQSDMKLVKVEDSNFEHLYVAIGENNTLIFASNNNKVIYMQYTGNEDINKLISLLELKF